MQLTDLIAIAIIIFVVGGAVAYIIKAKKSGKKCIGCPDACSCNRSPKSKDCDGAGTCMSCSSCRSCHGDGETTSRS